MSAIAPYERANEIGRARAVLGDVPDPEIPALSLVDLGVIRSIEFASDGTLCVGVSPTYSGCPATAVIRGDVVAALEAAGFHPVKVVDVLAPPWTSDWISADGRRRLQAYGIAPPPAPVTSVRQLAGTGSRVDCPRCGSAETELISEFGSTPCKALHRCRACLEPFDRFKCI